MLKSVTIFLFLLLSSFGACADEIAFKDGTIIQGTLGIFSDDGVSVIDENGLTALYPLEDIETVNGIHVHRQIIMSLPETRPTAQNTAQSPISQRIKQLIQENRSTLKEKINERKPENLPDVSEIPPWALALFAIGAIAFYVFVCFPYAIMAAKLRMPALWHILVWLPGLTLITMMRIGKINVQWFFVILAGLAASALAAAFVASTSPIIALGVILMWIPIGFVATCKLYFRITERCGKNKWLGLLNFLPFVCLIFPWYLALTMEPQEPEVHQKDLPTYPSRKYAITPFEDETGKKAI